jgi:acyl carrier protein
MDEKVFRLVKQAVDNLNEELQYNSLNDVTSATAIFGGEDGIDSLSLVTLVVGLEGDVEREFGKKVLLADEKAMSQRNSPYRTVGALVDFISERLGE